MDKALFPFILSLHPQAQMAVDPAGTVNVETPVQSCRLGQLAPELSSALQRLQAGICWHDLEYLVQQSPDVFGLAQLYYLMNLLAKSGLITRSIYYEDQLVVQSVPMQGHKHQIDFTPEFSPAVSWIWSRFACFRIEKGESLIESPLANGKILCGNHWLAPALIGLLTRATTGAAVAKHFPHIPAELIYSLLSFFQQNGLLQEINSEGQCREDTDIVLRQWEFHDLLFHAHSRCGRHDHPYGATFRFWNQIPPLPAVKESVSVAATIPLSKPDMDLLKNEDYPFSLILEERRSIREYDDRNPINLLQLGEFLYRTARIKRVEHMAMAGDIPYQLSKRNYAGGGGVYELELYPVVKRCDGLEPGLYHYHPLDHSLEKLSAHPGWAEAMLKMAVQSTDTELDPQVLIVIAARFQRLAWKYQSIAYAAILKNVGSLYQTMYLTATAMDLAPCALGGGNSDWLVEAAGLDYFTESAVGEFLLGSKRIR